jgi:hypothetical protein
VALPGSYSTNSRYPIENSALSTVMVTGKLRDLHGVHALRLLSDNSSALKRSPH